MNIENGEITMRYTRHSADPGRRPAIVQMMGQEVVAEVAALSVQLTSEDTARHGTVTLNFVGPEVEEVAALLAHGEFDVVIRPVAETALAETAAEEPVEQSVVEEPVQDTPAEQSA